MRRPQPFAGIAVEILVEEDVIAPDRIALEKRVSSMRWAFALGIEQKESEQSALEFRGYLAEVRLHARASRQLDGEAIAKPGMKVSQ